MNQREFWRASRENNNKQTRDEGTKDNNSSHAKDKNHMKVDVEAAADNREARTKIMRRRRRGKHTRETGTYDNTLNPRGHGGRIRTHQAKGDGTS